MAGPPGSRGVLGRLVVPRGFPHPPKTLEKQTILASGSSLGAPLGGLSWSVFEISGAAGALRGWLGQIIERLGALLGRLGGPLGLSWPVVGSP